ncbi:MAG: stage III sporulation protein AB [Oscillospiraceae bacterium]|jgi:stage III sporulation protein AB|nr:stage III sporulation protein AB [Oscillospiraceae bacterium]
MNMVGALLLAAAGALLGRYWVGRLRAREDALSALCVLLSNLRTQFEYIAPPLDELLDSLAEGDAAPAFLADCRARMRTGTSFARAWQEAVQTQCPALHRADREKLMAYGQSLGTTDAAGQSRSCALYAALFTQSRDAARREREKHGAYVPTLTLLLGVCAAILVL